MISIRYFENKIKKNKIKQYFFYMKNDNNVIHELIRDNKDGWTRSMQYIWARLKTYLNRNDTKNGSRIKFTVIALLQNCVQHLHSYDGVPDYCDVWCQGYFLFFLENETPSASTLLVSLERVSLVDNKLYSNSIEWRLRAPRTGGGCVHLAFPFLP